MKSLTLFFLVFITSFLYAQEKEHKIHFRFSSTPSFSINSFESKDLIKPKSGFGYEIAGNLLFDITNTIGFRTGLSLGRLNLRHRDYSPDYPGDVMDGEVDRYKSYFDFKTTYTFLGVPAMLKLKGKKPNHLYVAGGVHGRLHVATSGFVRGIEGGPQPSNYDPELFPFELKKFQMFLSVNPGFEWEAGRRKITLGPILEYSATPIFIENISALSNGHFAMIGLYFAYN